jgi:hypothetical protein
MADFLAGTAIGAILGASAIILLLRFGENRYYREDRNDRA